MTKKITQVQLAPGGPPCSWMEAGMVAYKLCDLDFKCEGCSFDQAMRGALPHAKTAPPQALLDVQDWAYPPDRRYHDGHTWAQQLNMRVVRVGLDPFAADLNRYLLSVILCPEGTVVKQNQIGCWLSNEVGLQPLRMPMSGKVIGVNERLRTNPELLIQQPLSEGWLIDIETEDIGREWPGLIRAPKMKQRSRQHYAVFQQQVAEAIKQGTTSVGATMADGGENLNDIRRILGAHKYQALMGEFM